MMRSFWICLLLFFISLRVFSQSTGSVKGFVYDKSTGEPVPFSNVYFQGTTIGANTDINGFFNISRIPPVNYMIVTVSLDFETLKEAINVTAGSVINKKFYVNKGGVKLDE